MNYYYDIYLNFDEEYYMFYEWDEKDDIEYIKKIPMYHVDNKTYNDFLINKVKVNKEFLEEIENKTKLENNKYLLYATIISDGKNSIAVEFNKEGLVISKSSILLEDEINIYEIMYSILQQRIEYEIISFEKIRKETKQESRVKNALKIEINNMYNDKNYNKLKYIYLEWFNKILDDYDLMYKNMLKKLDESLGNQEYKIYELIKATYNV